MPWDKPSDDAKQETKAGRDRWIGIYIACVAVGMALCTLGGGNATKDATLRNIDAANTWSFFQAKNLRRVNLELSTDDLELGLKTNPGMPPEAKQLLTERILQRRAEAAKLKSDPVSKEGLDQLWDRAKAIEKERDDALKRDPNFDFGQAALQIAIVLASVALIMSGNMLLIMSAVCAAIGALCTLNGFTLLFKIPFVG